MLVLQRKTGESIRIGENVLIKVVSIKGGRVRIAIDAPREVEVTRSELTQANQFPPQGRIVKERDGCEVVPA